MADEINDQKRIEVRPYLQRVYKAITNPELGDKTAKEIAAELGIGEKSFHVYLSSLRGAGVAVPEINGAESKKPAKSKVPSDPPDNLKKKKVQKKEVDLAQKHEDHQRSAEEIVGSLTEREKVIYNAIMADPDKKYIAIQREVEIKLPANLKRVYDAVTNPELGDKTSQEIAAELGIGTRTFQTYLSQLKSIGVSLPEIKKAKHSEPVISPQDHQRSPEQIVASLTRRERIIYEAIIQNPQKKYVNIKREIEIRLKTTLKPIGIYVGHFRDIGLEIPYKITRKWKQEAEVSEGAIDLEKRLKTLSFGLKTVYDAVSKDPNKSYNQIASQLGKSRTVIASGVKKLQDLGLLSKPEEDKLESAMKKEKEDRNQEICDILTTENKTLYEVASQYGITRERVRQIAKRKGITKRELQRQRKKGLEKQRAEQKKVQSQHQILVTQLNQYYFNRLAEEKSLDYALAWRYKEYHAKEGRYSREENLEELATLIRARRSGLGYYKSIKAAKIATTTHGVKSIIGGIAHILNIALADVAYKKEHEGFENTKYLRTEEERRSFSADYQRFDISSEEILKKYNIPNLHMMYNLASTKGIKRGNSAEKRVYLKKEEDKENFKKDYESGMDIGALCIKYMGTDSTKSKTAIYSVAFGLGIHRKKE